MHNNSVAKIYQLNIMRDSICLMKKNLPFSIACERNKEPILSVLKKYVLSNRKLLEIGHGTGQHAMYLSQELQVRWFASDLPNNNIILKNRLAQTNNPYLEEVFSLTIGEKPLDEQTNQKYDYLFTANTFHIMSEDLVRIFCEQAQSVLKKSAYLFIYGPFKFNGQFTSESNTKFDQILKSKNPLMGIRDFEYIKNLFAANHLSFVGLEQLPANNQLLIFQRN